MNWTVDIKQFHGQVALFPYFMMTKKNTKVQITKKNFVLMKLKSCDSSLNTNHKNIDYTLCTSDTVKGTK